MSTRRFCRNSEAHRLFNPSILSGEEETGVTIMLMDAKIDNGSILASQKLKVESQNLNAKELEEKLAELGGEMLVDTIPKWINGEIKAKEQDHNEATFYQENYQRRRLRGLGKRFSGNNLQKISRLPALARRLLFFQ